LSPEGHSALESSKDGKERETTRDWFQEEIEENEPTKGTNSRWMNIETMSRQNLPVDIVSFIRTSIRTPIRDHSGVLTYLPIWIWSRLDRPWDNCWPDSRKVGKVSKGWHKLLRIQTMFVQPWPFYQHSSKDGQEEPQTMDFIEGLFDHSWQSLLQFSLATAPNEVHKNRSFESRKSWRKKKWSIKSSSIFSIDRFS
jgi:hypothetical protein